MEYTYNFPSVKGKQANSNYYICMIPCSLLKKLFWIDNNEVDPIFRAQRKVNYNRIPEIKKYILQNRDSYVFSALAASINGEFEFEEITNNIGTLKVSMDSIFLINDGQHRNAALQAAIEEDESLGSETIPIVFFADNGLIRSKQMFTDLNKHAINTSKSLNTLYDSKDKLAIVTRESVKNNSFFNLYTELEKDTLGKYSANLFTLNNFYNANKMIIQGHDLDIKLTKFINDFWFQISINICEWNELQSKTITKKSLREDYIITQGIVLLAFGKLANFFYSSKHIQYKKYIKKLSTINWLRRNPIWEGRALANGKIIRKESTIKLIYIKIKELIGLELTEQEQELNNLTKAD